MRVRMPGSGRCWGPLRELPTTNPYKARPPKEAHELTLDRYGRVGPGPRTGLGSQAEGGNGGKPRKEQGWFTEQQDASEWGRERGTGKDPDVAGWAQGTFPSPESSAKSLKDFSSSGWAWKVGWSRPAWKREMGNSRWSQRNVRSQRVTRKRNPLKLHTSQHRLRFKFSRPKNSCQVQPEPYHSPVYWSKGNLSF